MDTGPFDRDGDLVTAQEDCDDDDASRSPKLDEICNGQDDDCDGLVDQDDPDIEVFIWYADVDGDGFGDDATAESPCEAPTDRVRQGGDCDDTDPAVNPDAQEICSFVDDDCDGLVDDLDDSVDESGFATWYPDADDDNHGVPGETVVGCDPGPNHAPNDTDCDDTEPLAWGGAAEICGDGVDNDCDGLQGADCGVFGSVSAADASVAWGGVDGAGAVVVPVGDTDGDGLVDWVVGAPDGGSSVEVGQSYLMRAGGWRGGALDLVSAGVWLGTEDGSRAGAAVVGLGDLDGDGLADLAVGAPRADGLAEDSGVVSLVVGTLSAPSPLSSSLALLFGDDVGAQTGHALVAAGDPSGDGVMDLLIGAYAGGGDRAPGQAHLVSGAVTGSVDVAAVALLTLTGERDYGYAGMALASGDLDGDGLIDLAIGGPLDDQAGTASGAAWVVAGGTVGTVSLADADAEVQGTRAGDLLGSSVAIADLDGDGLGDLVVGVPGASGADEGAGAVGIFAAAESGSFVLADAEGQRHGVGPFELAGTALSAGGDYNGDGLADLVVGSPYGSGGAGRTGAAYVILGPVSGSGSVSDAVTILLGNLEGDLAGGAVALIPDQDGDGADELVVGAPGASALYALYGGGGL